MSPLSELFAQPAFLGLAGFLLLVIAAFLHRRRGPVVVVPSTLLWESALERRARRRRFAKIQQVLALLALVSAVLLIALAAAGPEPRQGGRVVFVVDGSGSMGDAEGPLGAARALIAAEGALFAGAGEVALIFAGARPRILVPPTRSSARLQEGLAELSALRGEGESDPESALRLAIAVAEGARHEEDVADRVLFIDDGTAAIDIDRLPESTHVEIGRRRVDGAMENVGITLFAARPPARPQSDEDREIVVALASRRAETVTLVLESGLGAEGAQEWTPIEERRLELSGEGEVETTFRLQLPLRWVRARLERDGAADRIPLDDQAVLALGGGGPPTVIVVGELPAAERFFAARALSSLGADTIDLPADGRIPEGAVVVQLGEPTRRFDAPTLWIPSTREPDSGTEPDADSVAEPSSDAGAGAGSGFLPALSLGPRAGEAAHVREIQEDHPVMRGVDLVGATFVRVHAVDPGEGRPLVTVDGGGAVIAAGGTGRGRWVHLGMGAGGSDVVLRVAYPVLVANALVWLAGASDHVAVTPASAVELQAPPADGAPPRATGWRVWLGRLLSRGPWALLALVAGLLLLVEGVAYARGAVR